MDRPHLTNRSFDSLSNKTFNILCFRLQSGEKVRTRKIFFVLLGRPILILCFATYLRARPSANRRETLPHHWKWVHFYNPSPKIRKTPPAPKNWGLKSCKIRSDFGQLQTLIANISWTDPRYQKSKRHVIDCDFSRVRRQKSSELWSTNNKVGDVSLDPPKSTFSKDHISAPIECAPFKFLHYARKWPRLANLHPPGTGVSPTIFNNNNQIVAQNSAYLCL